MTCKPILTEKGKQIKATASTKQIVAIATVTRNVTLKVGTASAQAAF